MIRSTLHERLIRLQRCNVVVDINEPLHKAVIITLKRIYNDKVIQVNLQKRSLKKLQLYVRGKIDTQQKNY